MTFRLYLLTDNDCLYRLPLTFLHRGSKQVAFPHFAGTAQRMISAGFDNDALWYLKGTRIKFDADGCLDWERVNEQLNTRLDFIYAKQEAARTAVPDLASVRGKQRQLEHHEFAPSDAHRAAIAADFDTEARVPIKSLKRAGV